RRDGALERRSGRRRGAARQALGPNGRLGRRRTEALVAMTIDLSLVGTELAALSHSYSWRDVVIYALGAGAKADELPFLYEAEGPKVLPTFATVPAFRVLAATAGRLG